MKAREIHIEKNELVAVFIYGNSACYGYVPDEFSILTNQQYKELFPSDYMIALSKLRLCMINNLDGYYIVRNIARFKDLGIRRKDIKWDFR